MLSATRQPLIARLDFRNVRVRTTLNTDGENMFVQSSLIYLSRTIYDRPVILEEWLRTNIRMITYHS